MFPLNVLKSGLGSGVVTSNPPGIDCSSACAWNFPSETVVTLTAQPSPGSVFGGWADDCSGTATTWS